MHYIAITIIVATCILVLYDLYKQKLNTKTTMIRGREFYQDESLLGEPLIRGIGTRNGRMIKNCHPRDMMVV